MKLERAIEIKEAYFRGDLPDDPLDLVAADRLSVEALKEVERLRRVEAFDPTIALPGETQW